MVKSYIDKETIKNSKRLVLNEIEKRMKDRTTKRCNDVNAIKHLNDIDIKTNDLMNTVFFITNNIENSSIRISNGIEYINRFQSDLYVYTDEYFYHIRESKYKKSYKSPTSNDETESGESFVNLYYTSDITSMRFIDDDSLEITLDNDKFYLDINHSYPDEVSSKEVKNLLLEFFYKFNNIES